jgi:16S rRNA processing protein RimM
VGLVRLGKVVRAVGLKGHVGIAGTEGALETLGRIAFRRGDEDPVHARILEARRQGRLWAVKVEGVADRTAAEALVGAEVLAYREELGEAGEGKHWWADLEGLDVVTVAGEVVGKVTGLYETGGVDVLVVEGERGERLVPLAPYVEVDVAARRIVVDPPEGLLD